MSQQITRMALLSRKNKVGYKILFITQLKYYGNLKARLQAPYKGAVYEENNILQFLTVSFRAKFFLPFSPSLLKTTGLLD